MKQIDKLIKCFNTRDPFLIAKELGIRISILPLGQVRGYYTNANRIKTIHINQDLTDRQQLFTAAHELGHAILHPTASTPFLRSCTHFSVEKLEVQANSFAVHLLISDEDLEEYNEYTLNQLSAVFGLHEKLIELRLKKSC